MGRPWANAKNGKGSLGFPTAESPDRRLNGPSTELGACLSPANPLERSATFAVDSVVARGDSSGSVVRRCAIDDY